MNKVMVDQQWLSQLGDPTKSAELCDEEGRTLGYFVPVGEDLGLAYAWARGEIGDAEIDAARREPGGQSLDEILRALPH